MLKEVKQKFYIFQKEICPIIDLINEKEYDFIIKTLSSISEDDIYKNEHLSSYSYPISISGKSVNSSRFIFGTKTNPNLFQKNATKMLKSLNIQESSPDGFQWYGIGWDMENNEIKIYFLKKDFSQIFCKEFRRSSGAKIRDKIYQVGKYVTTMRKDKKIIEQININSLEHEIVDKMNGLGFELDTYSEYNNKKTFYFD